MVNSNNNENNINESVNQLFLNIDISDLIQDIQNRTIALIRINGIGKIWEKIRSRGDFEYSQIDADGAIKDINLLLEKYKYEVQDEGFLREYSKLALGNTCKNVGNDGFEVYVIFLQEVGVEITKNELIKIAGEKEETKIKSSVNYY